jgi:hypothetical protein
MRLLFILAASLLSTAVHAQSVYKCTVDGKTSYSDRPCAHGASKPLPPPPAGISPADTMGPQGGDARTLLELEKARIAREKAQEKEERAQAKDSAHGPGPAPEMRQAAPAPQMGRGRPGAHSARPEARGRPYQGEAPGGNPGGGMSGLGLLSRWLLFGEWRAHPMRALLAVVAIAVGVAMGFAIHLINAAAFNEFSAAIQSLAGQADLQVAGREAQFDESIYPRLALHAGVAVASPVLEVDAALAGKPGALKIVGLDALRAGYVSPDLAGVPSKGRGADVLADDTIFLSPAAQAWLGLRTDSTLLLRAGTRDVPLRVAGPILRARSGQRLAVMDIGALQWRFNQLGKLSRSTSSCATASTAPPSRARLRPNSKRISPAATRWRRRTTPTRKAATITSAAPTA